MDREEMRERGGGEEEKRREERRRRERTCHLDTAIFVPSFSLILSAFPLFCPNQFQQGADLLMERVGTSRLTNSPLSESVGVGQKRL